MLNNVRRAAIVSGKTIPVTLNMISQTPYPIVHIEHLGRTNKQWLADQLMETAATNAVESSIKSSADLAVLEAKNRETLAKYVLRKIENFFNDGPDGEPDFKNPVASDAAGIRAVADALPYETVELLLQTARNPERFREHPKTAPAADVAKK